MIKLKIKIPKKSGVYFFKNKKREILYIGKAADLRNRLRFYFSKGVKDARILGMLKNATGVSWQKTDSEIEALILESQLIKKHRPAFNILMRDDKQYFYVSFTKEVFPKVLISHQQKDIGPFTDGGALKTTLKFLRRIFPYCTCKEKHNNYCLNYHLGNCSGFCCLKSDKSQAEDKKNYHNNIKSIKNILSGKRSLLAKKLESEMEQAAKNDEFIKAISLRNKIKQLKWVFENAKIISKSPEDCPPEALEQIPRRIEAYDISNIQSANAVGSMAVFTNGQPDKNQYRKFKIRRILSSEALREGFGDTNMLREVLSRRFKHKEWPLPDLVMVDGGKAQLNAAFSAVPKQIPIIALTKNEKHQASHIFILKKPKPLSLNFLTSDVRKLILEINNEAHRFAISYYRKAHRKNLTKYKD